MDELVLELIFDEYFLDKDVSDKNNYKKNLLYLIVGYKVRSYLIEKVEKDNYNRFVILSFLMLYSKFLEGIKNLERNNHLESELQTILNVEHSIPLETLLLYYCGVLGKKDLYYYVVLQPKFRNLEEIMKHCRNREGIYYIKNKILSIEEMWDGEIILLHYLLSNNVLEKDEILQILNKKISVNHLDKKIVDDIEKKLKKSTNKYFGINKILFKWKARKFIKKIRR